MKNLIIFATLLLGAYSYTPKVAHKIDPYILEDVINATIEGIRPDIPEPIAIPELNLNLPDVDSAVVRGNASISNLSLSGLKNFEIQALAFNPLALHLNLTAVVPTIDFSTNYVLNLNIADAVPIYGSGSLKVNLEQAQLRISTGVNLSKGVQLENLLVEILLGDAKFELHGLFNDDDLSELISSILNDLVVRLLDERHELVTQLISPLLEGIINSILANLGQGGAVAEQN